MSRQVILKNISLLGIQEILFNIIGTAFYVLLARHLGESGLGTYSYVLSITGFIAMFLDLGIVSMYWRKWINDRSHVEEDINNLLTTKIAILIPITLLFFTYSYLFERKILPFIAIVYVALLFETLRSTVSNLLAARNQFSSYFVVNFVDRFGSLVGGIVLLLLGMGVVPVFLMYTISRILSTLVSLHYVPIHYRLRFSLSSIKQVIYGSIPTFLLLFLGTFYFKIDNVFIKHLLGIDAVGLYNSAYRIFELFLIIPSILGTASIPTLQVWMHEGQHEKVNISLNFAIKYICLFAGFVAIFFTFYSREILHFLYGASFIDAGVILIYLGWTVIPLLLSNFLSYVLYAQKKERYLILRLISLSGINVALNLILIPQFHVVGSAIATLITELINVVLLLRVSNMQLHVQWMWLFVPSLLILTGVLTITHPPLILMGCLAGGFYGGVLLATRTVRFKELGLFIPQRLKKLVSR